jgi:bacitracin transport system ATP-binding protein
MSHHEPVLETINLGKAYDGAWAVEKLHLTVRRGEIYGFLGRNGAGKTTTIRMIMGLIRPTSGEIRLFGRPRGAWGTELFRRIGVTIEYPGFYPNLTARENLTYNAEMHGIRERGRVDAMLAFMGLKDAADRPVKGFSLGMKQRLGLARALLHEPELLILDEPTNGLDPAGIREMRELIRRLAEEQGITIMLSSHILSEIEQVATRVGIVHQGRLVEEMAMADLVALGRQYLDVRVNDVPAALRLLEAHLDSPRVEVLENGCLRLFDHLEEPHRINRLLNDHELDVMHLAMRQETLEDRFMRLTGGTQA